MTDAVLPALFALFAWWFSTGAIMFAVGQAPATFKWTMLGMTGLLAVALIELPGVAADTSASGAYWAFVFGLVAWAWPEASFLTGIVTGPRTIAAPENPSPRDRFAAATATVIHHELVIALIGAALLALTWDAPNKIALWTYVILWVLRLSAKFNLFLGVPNNGRELLPPHLAYIASYLPTRPMNWLFPVSVTVGTGVTVALVALSLHPGTTPAAATGLTLLAALAGLGVLEHWVMVLPLKLEKLFSWVAPGQNTTGTQSWSQPLSADCDPNGLKTVLDAVAQGHYGNVEQLQGVAKAGAGWVHFNVMAGTLRMAAIVPGHREQPRVTAVGHRFDVQRLKAAFETCAVSAA
jgi:putative photosynthetic complex assembly protein 2